MVCKPSSKSVKKCAGVLNLTLSTPLPRICANNEIGVCYEQVKKKELNVCVQQQTNNLEKTVVEKKIRKLGSR